MKVIAKDGDRLIMEFTAGDLRVLNARKNDSYHHYWKEDKEIVSVFTAMIQNNIMATKIATGERTLAAAVKTAVKHVLDYVEAAAHVAADMEKSCGDTED